MHHTALTILLTLLVISSEVASQYCSYNAKGSTIGVIECDKPSEDVTGIFVPEGNIPQIKKGLFAPFTKLDNIYMGRVNIEKIEPGAFDGLKLKALQLNNNNIKTIEPGTFNSLNITTQLEIASNQLESLGANIFLGMKSLTWISLSGNKLKIIDKEAFNGLDKLEYLHMIYNKLESLELGTFDSLVSLQLLDLSSNSLREIKFGLFAQQRNLNKLILYQNQLETLPDHLFDNLTSVQTIDVSRNKLRELQENLFYGIENLQALKFNDNNIAQFNARSLLVHVPKLEEVELFNNPWKCEDLRKMKGDFEIKNVASPIPVPVVDSPNVNGIGCNE